MVALTWLWFTAIPYLYLGLRHLAFSDWRTTDALAQQAGCASATHTIVAPVTTGALLGASLARFTTGAKRLKSHPPPSEFCGVATL